MNRERLLLLYCLVVGGVGWVWLAITPRLPAPLAALLLFGALALAVDTLSFRVPPTDAHSMGGLVLLAAALGLGPAPAALLAAWEGLLSGALMPFVWRRPRSIYLLLARPFLRGGLRAAGILAGAALASAAAGAPQYDPARINPEALLLWAILAYTATLQLGRVGREFLQGGPSGVTTWWRSTWRLALGVELAPLPLALLGAAIYRQLGIGHFFMAGLALIAAATAVRRASLNLQSQRRSVRELALLNEASRAIIRSELDAEALCELIYREASKVIDTGSFHLGLFEGKSYTLMVRVQDRVRLPRLTVDLPAGDGIIGWIRQTGRALLVDDFAQEMSRLPARPRYQSERPPRSGIYVPLIAGEDVIGSISVQSYQPSAFGANDLRLLSLIADQAAVAITRARAFHQASQRAVQLQAVHEVSEQITAILNLDALLPSVVRLIREHFGYHPVHIFTIDHDEQVIRFRASTADVTRQEILTAEPMRPGQGVVGSAAASRAPVLVGDVRLDRRYIRDSKDTRSELAVPLRIGDQVIGVLDVQSDQVDDFDADDLFVMQTLAGQIAVAIDSANTYTAQQEEAWTLNALLQVSENIGRASTLDTLLSTVVRVPPLLIGSQPLLLPALDARGPLRAAGGLRAGGRAARAAGGAVVRARRGAPAGPAARAGGRRRGAHPPAAAPRRAEQGRGVAAADRAGGQRHPGGPADAGPGQPARRADLRLGRARCAAWTAARSTWAPGRRPRCPAPWRACCWPARPRRPGAWSRSCGWPARSRPPCCPPTRRRSPAGRSTPPGARPAWSAATSTTSGRCRGRSGAGSRRPAAESRRRASHFSERSAPRRPPPTKARRSSPIPRAPSWAL